MIPLAERPHGLYRFYDSDGELLYIGITADLPTRLDAHNGEKPWWTTAVRITIQHFDSRDEVLAAEKSAIIAERPRHNVVHNAGRTPLPTVDFLAGELISLLDDWSREDVWRSTELDRSGIGRSQREHLLHAAVAASAHLHQQIAHLIIALRSLVDSASVVDLDLAETAAGFTIHQSWGSPERLVALANQLCSLRLARNLADLGLAHKEAKA